MTASDRELVVEAVASAVPAEVRGRAVRIGIDGLAGAGKTVFAGELSRALDYRRRTVVRLTTDADAGAGAELVRAFATDPAHPPGAVVVVDGRGLLGDELAGMWDVSVYLLEAGEAERRASFVIDNAVRATPSIRPGPPGAPRPRPS